MKIYKPIHLIQATPTKEVKKISKLFSNYEDDPIRNNSNFDLVFVRYSPDVYFSHGEEIGKLFESDTFDPLVMTNYKFLALLLVCSSNPMIVFSDFSFKNSDESDRSEENREHIKEMIESEDKVTRSFKFLKNIGQRISRIELSIESTRNKVVVYSNGNIGLSNNFPSKYYKEVFPLVELLFTGELPNEK
ncbi:hypothetical protein [Lactococcus cremoris]|uniref:hypothetical protein n=2 Tax=Lactococcus lactis subsp. cremoris TaxID=1359 RepID=UPI002182357B|nr:hypothetical protein [Lactococcus cremoris]MCT0506805.1 hypothetical protein [Lactococcus cremoris]